MMHTLVSLLVITEVYSKKEVDIQTLLLLGPEILTILGFHGMRILPEKPLELLGISKSTEQMNSLIGATHLVCFKEHNPLIL
jgi:hypothetical protein